MTKPNSLAECRRPDGRLDPRRVRRYLRKVRGKRTTEQFGAALRESFASTMAARMWGGLLDRLAAAQEKL